MNTSRNFSPAKMISEVTESGNAITFPSIFGSYKYLSTIGTGATGVVVRTIHLKTREISATKIVSRADLMKRDLFSSFEQELRVQQSLNHPNIVKILDVVYGDENIYVVMEFCGNGDLFEWAQKGIYSNTTLLRKTFYQLISAVYYMHKRNIAHLDLKPENVLLDGNFNVKLTDFGCCETPIPKNTKEFYGTLYYTAPEILDGSVQSFDRSDLFSLGVILYALVTGALPWPEGSDEDVKYYIMNCEYSIPSSVPPMIAQIISLCIVQDPDDRISIDEIFQTPWMLEERHKLQNEIEKKPSISKTKSLATNLTLRERRPLVVVRSEISRIPPPIPKISARSVAPPRIKSLYRHTYSEGQLPKLTLKRDESLQLNQI